MISRSLVGLLSVHFVVLNYISYFSRSGTLCGSNCGSQILYDPSKSSTYVDGGENSTINCSSLIPLQIVAFQADRISLPVGTCLGVHPVTEDYVHPPTI